ncbi:hypothetical protein JW935_17045 [candidate division KSB1 bacterium]|nr:hypothetical protein [candidate division KSB1 bacterium]
MINPTVKDFCLYFDGLNDKVIIYDNDDQIDAITTQVTLEVWMKLESLQELVGRIIDRSDNQSDDRYVLEVFNQDGRPIIHLNINRNSLWF